MIMEILKEKSKIISYAVFALTLAVVILYLISLFFPALVISLTNQLETEINPFEIGAWTVPFLIANLSLLGIGILYYRKRLPIKIIKFFKFIYNLEISRRVSITIMIILLIGYMAYAAQDLRFYEGEQWGDFIRIERVLEEYPAGEGHLATYIVTNSLLKASEVIFQNVKAVPFIASIFLLIITYLITVKISKKRFAGLISVIVLLQSFTFHRYDTLATYPNFWVLFYILSLYLIYNKWYLSPAAFILSIFSKALSIVLLPFSLFFIYNSELSKKKKIYTTLPWLVIFVIVFALIFAGVPLASGNKFSFSWSDLITGFATLSYQLRFDGLLLIFLLPLTVALFLASRKGIKEADSMLVLLMGGILLQPILAAFTGFNLFPYRYMPLVVFFAMGVGTILSKSGNRFEKGKN